MATWSQAEVEKYYQLAKDGDIKAQIYLGWAYAEGKLIPKNNDLATEWLSCAANLGSEEAKYRLAMILINQGRSDGVEMLTDDLLNNFPPAFYELGNCYYSGILVQRDPTKAENYWAQATAGGHAIANIKLLKYKGSRVKFYLKPFYVFRTIFALLRAISIFINNENDLRVLGSFR